MGEEHAEKHGHEITIMQDWEKYKKFVKKFKKQSETWEVTRWWDRVLWHVQNGCMVSDIKRVYDDCKLRFLKVKIKMLVFLLYLFTLKHKSWYEYNFYLLLEGVLCDQIVFF